jgi:hypothetical protein
MPTLESRLTAVEDNLTERKLEGAKSSELRRTLVAFANSASDDRPAVLFIGVQNDGTIVGVSNPDAIQKSVRKVAEHDCYPPISTRSEVITYGTRHVVAVEVPQSSKRPHFAGGAYIRRGSESVVASDQVFDELIASRNSKAGALIRLKGALLTVIASRTELGSTKHLGDSSYRARHECRIDSVSAHFVRMHDISTGRNVSEPLDRVTISFDEEGHRPMLVVQPVGT